MFFASPLFRGRLNLNVNVNIKGSHVITQVWRGFHFNKSPVLITNWPSTSEINLCYTRVLSTCWFQEANKFYYFNAETI